MKQGEDSGVVRSTMNFNRVCDKKKFEPRCAEEAKRPEQAAPSVGGQRGGLYA